MWLLEGADWRPQTGRQPGSGKGVGGLGRGRVSGGGRGGTRAGSLGSAPGPPPKLCAGGTLSPCTLLFAHKMKVRSELGQNKSPPRLSLWMAQNQCPSQRTPRPGRWRSTEAGSKHRVGGRAPAWRAEGPGGAMSPGARTEKPGSEQSLTWGREPGCQSTSLGSQLCSWDPLLQIVKQEGGWKGTPVWVVRHPSEGASCSPGVRCGSVLLQLPHVQTPTRAPAALLCPLRATVTATGLASPSSPCVSLDSLGPSFLVCQMGL